MALAACIETLSLEVFQGSITPTCFLHPFFLSWNDNYELHVRISTVVPA